jgi:hypothetical protein
MPNVMTDKPSNSHDILIIVKKYCFPLDLGQTQQCGWTWKLFFHEVNES